MPHRKRRYRGRHRITTRRVRRWTALLGAIGLTIFGG